MFPSTVNADSVHMSHSAGHTVVKRGGVKRERNSLSAPLPAQLHSCSDKEAEAAINSLSQDDQKRLCLTAASLDGAEPSVLHFLRLPSPSPPSAADGATPHATAAAAADAMTIVLDSPLVVSAEGGAVLWLPCAPLPAVAVPTGGGGGSRTVPSAAAAAAAVDTEQEQVLPTKWNTTIFSVGTARAAGWGGGGKSSSETLADMKSRFASGSFNRIVAPQTEWTPAAADEWLRQHICVGLQQADATWGAWEPCLRSKKVAFGPVGNIALRLQPATSSPPHTTQGRAAGQDDPYAPPV